MINCDCVVSRCTGESIIPRRRPVVEISSCIASDINSLPPQIHMQLISLEGTPRILARANQGPGILVPQAEISSVGTRTCDLRSLLDRLHTEPQRSLIPRARR